MSTFCAHFSVADPVDDVAERTPSGKILKADLRKVAAAEWARRTGSQAPKSKL